MNDQMFASMAEQMHPDEEVLSRLSSRLDELDAAEHGPAGPVPTAPARRRVPPARAWIGIAAALLVCVLLVPTFTERLGATPSSGTMDRAEAVPAAGPADYSQVYRAAAQAAARNPEGSGVWYGTDARARAEDGSGVVPGAATAGGKATSSAGYQTNAQIAGIDEGDIVKSDGHTIYVASGKKVAVVLPDGAGTRQVASIDTSAGEAGKTGSAGVTMQGPVQDLELHGTILVVLVTDYTARTDSLPASLPGGVSTTMVPFDASVTKALLYDVANPDSPKYLTTLGQSGALVTTRLSGDLLYVVTNYAIADTKRMNPDDPQTFVPMTVDGGRAVPLPAGKCGFVPEPSGPTYTVVSSLDLGTHKRTDTVSVLGGTATVSMSATDLYLAAADYQPSAKEKARAGVPVDLKNAQTTQLARVAIETGRLSLAAQGAVPGNVLNQFALDEYQGNLRVVTTLEGEQKGNWSQRAGLYVLDADLRTVGKIPSLVSGESVRSVRFDGATGYVVTFRQMDPLFALDLSTATAPRVLSALKIPGFSSYLQTWGQGRLLGLGRDATSGGEDRGLKLSMFDVSDPRDVTETTTLRIGKAYDDAEALYDHRAVLVDAEDGLIGFATTNWSTGSPRVRYLVFRYEEGKGFSELGAIQLAAAKDGSIPSFRGLAIGEFTYVASSRGVGAYTSDSLKKVAEVSLKA